jgi:glycosyltransferase involved in cell wall biosynthesis
MTHSEKGSNGGPGSDARSGLSIIIPVYNERESVEKTVRELVETVSTLPYDTEIIVVNDGSGDGTTETVKRLCGGRVRGIHHPTNRGYGASLKSGIRAARFPHVAITDADGTYPSARIPEMYEQAAAGGCDMIVGARTGAKVHVPLLRRPAKWFLTGLAKYLTGIRIPDLNSGLRIMKKDVVERFLNILPEGFSFTTTITLALFTNGYSVEYVPINYKKRVGRSKIRPVYDTLNFLQLILRTVLYFDPLKIFIPPSVVCMVVSAGLMAYRIFVGSAFAAASIMFFVCGIQLLAIGMIADLVDKRLK